MASPLRLGRTRRRLTRRARESSNPRTSLHGWGLRPRMEWRIPRLWKARSSIGVQTMKVGQGISQQNERALASPRHKQRSIRTRLWIPSPRWSSPRLLPPSPPMKNDGHAQWTTSHWAQDTELVAEDAGSMLQPPLHQHGGHGPKGSEGATVAPSRSRVEDENTDSSFCHGFCDDTGMHRTVRSANPRE